jgi:DNA primase
MMLLGHLAPKEVGLMFDGDDAGVAFTDRAAAKLGKLFAVRKLFVPRGTDPKNLCREEIESVVKKSRIVLQ